MSKRIELAAGAALGLAILATAAPARATNYTITVDVSKQTAGNPRFWVAAVGTGTASLTLRGDLQTHYKIGNRELGALRVRGHGLLNDDMGLYKGAGSYDWTKLDTYLTAIVSAGMRPIMELDFMPTALSTSGNSRNPPKDYATWKAFITALVQHCVDKYGATDVGQWYWEVWNEPDYVPGFWTGTMADYYTLYDNTVAAISAVLPNAFVGGPATTQSGPIQAFLQHCRSAGTRVTFASSHVYPGGASSGTAANAAGLLNDNNSRVSGITGAGYTTAQVKSFNTEWNSSYNGQGGLTGDVVTSMDNHWNAGFILKAVKLLSDKNSGDTPPADVMSYWVLSDVFDESSGPNGSYILGKSNGNLPFGQVFGMMTAQGMRKAAFNAFKMLAYLGPKRLMSGGGTGGDGVDAMATMSANSDEVQVLVYNQFATMNTTGTDMVTITLSNLPAALANKELFLTHFRVDETHSNPYNAWAAAGKPASPTEAQWQTMKVQQHLALLQPVAKATTTTTYTTSFSIPRQAGSLVILGVKRPVTGRNAFVEIEAEDYDGQSGITKQPDSGDSTTLGQSITGNSGANAFFLNTDFSDTGVGAVQLRVNTSAATTLELRADSQTAGTLLGTCQIASTSGAWATQTCNLTPTSGVHTLYVNFGGTVRLNHLKFQAGTGGTGTGGTGGGTGGTGGGSGGRGGTGGSSGGSSGGAGSGAGGRGGTVGSGGNGNGGTGSGAAGTGVDPSGVAGTGVDPSGAAGTGVDPSGAAGTGVDPSGAAGTTGTSGAAGNSGSAGSGAGSGGGGCACDIGGAGQPSAAMLIAGLAAIVLRHRRRRT